MFEKTHTDVQNKNIFFQTIEMHDVIDFNGHIGIVTMIIENDNGKVFIATNVQTGRDMVVFENEAKIIAKENRNFSIAQASEEMIKAQAFKVFQQEFETFTS